MSADTENFPRGGRRIIPNEIKRKIEENLFTPNKEPKAKKARKEKRPVQLEDIHKEDSWLSSLNLYGTLTYNKIQEGMVVLGCVRRILNLAIQLELPGLTFAHVPINCISDTFTNVITKGLRKSSQNFVPSAELAKVVHIGQLVSAKVMSVKNSDNGHEIDASINARDVYQGISHNSFKKGATIWAWVASELDHGYELSIGNQNLRVFLPFKNINEGVRYNLGQPLFCVAHKSEESDGTATTLTVSSRIDHVDKMQLNEIPSIEMVVPGTKIELVITEVLPHGIKGKFLDNFYAYLDRSHFFSKINPHKLHQNSVIQAYVLYTQPVTKITYLTLRNLDDLPQSTYEIGQHVVAEIIEHFPHGMALKFGRSENRGFITNRRLVNCLSKSIDSEVLEGVRSKFKIGTIQTCRILDYNRMEALHICTFESKLIKEKIFAKKDLKVGLRVEVSVMKIVPNGLIVKSGLVQGFVPNLHLSNTEFSETIKGKFTEAQVLPARVLNLTDEGNILFTLKPSLVQSDKCLDNYDDAIVGAQFVGFVVKTSDVGALVAFYGKIKGWINCGQLNSGKTGEHIDPRDYFFRGQVVTVYSLGMNGNKLQLSLKPPNEKKKKLDLGQKYVGKIIAIDGDGLTVQIADGNISAILPVAHLSPILGYCESLRRTYKIGDDIPNLICVMNAGIQIVSLRESWAFDENLLQMLNFHEITKGMTLRCSYDKDLGSGILVSIPIFGLKKKIVITNENLFCKVDNRPTYEKYQLVLAKVLEIDYKTKSLVLVAREDQFKITHPNLHGALRLLAKSLVDQDHIITWNRKYHSRLYKYKLGQRLKFKVYKKSDEGGCFVGLSSGARGWCPPHLSFDGIQVGDSVEGVVIDYNSEKRFLEVCLKPNLVSKIDKIQNGASGNALLSQGSVKILSIKNHYAMGIFKCDDCNGQLVYLPINEDERFTQSLKNYYGRNKLEVIIKRRINGKLIVIPKKMAKTLDKLEKSRAKKRLAEQNELLTEDGEKTDEENMEIDEEEKNGNGSIDEDNSIREGGENSEEDEGEKFTEGVDSSIEEQSEDESVERSVGYEDDAMEDSEENSIDDEESSIENEAEIESLSHPQESDSSLGNGADDEKIVAADENTDDQDSEDEVEPKMELKPETKSIPILSGVSSFYSTDTDSTDVIKKEEESSSDDDDEENEQKPKKKLTSTEKAERARQEEERISKIENELIASRDNPQSAEQFDRILLAHPDSSELWLRYIAMHVATTELDKARAVGKRALETINMTQIKEKFNIWIALLNLENMYGTKESFDNLFNDATRYNDSLEVYLNVIKMLASSGKLSEMEEKIRKVRGKEKQNSRMWLEVGQTYYTLAQFKEARNIKEAALKSITDKKRQFDLIVKFGIMEFQLGELDQAVANFETILETYPAKINIWIIYVDQLIKKHKIDDARKILDRAIGQKLPPKSMKSLYQKFVSFEEQHGTADNVANVKIRAKMYVDNLSKR